MIDVSISRIIPGKNSRDDNDEDGCEEGSFFLIVFVNTLFPAHDAETTRLLRRCLWRLISIRSTVFISLFLSSSSFFIRMYISFVVSMILAAHWLFFILDGFTDEWTVNNSQFETKTNKKNSILYELATIYLLFLFQPYLSWLWLIYPDGYDVFNNAN